ncbi:MAG: cytochrome c [Gammaproteobacteria bacterium]|nr:MAG: cytochrome c [Gammaproteobacteria bacterium]
MRLIALLALCAVGTAAADPAAELYREHCAGCHGADRLGGSGPALLPQTLARLGEAALAAVLRDGLPATQMPGFGGRLEAAELAELAAFLRRDPDVPVRWTETDLRASHRVYARPEPDAKPRFAADPLNVFVVVETGDHHITLLDGDRFRPIHRFATRPALHGGPKFSPDGRFVYLAARDGWITLYDLYRLETVAEIRVGLNTRNLAVSHDGRYVAVANQLPHTLVLLDARDLSLLKILPAVDREGRSSRVAAVYTAPPRGSFVAALRDAREIWEIPYREGARVYNGLVHDHRLGEALAEPGPFPVRQIAVDTPLEDFFFDSAYRHLVGAARVTGGLYVVQLDVGRVIARLDLPGMPHLGAGITWRWQDRDILAVPHLQAAKISFIDTRDWSLLGSVDTLGPGFFIRSHPESPYAWADVFFGPHRDAVHLIDKRSLKIAHTLVPEPGRTSAHVEFTRDGRHALLSIREDDGALLVYDARSLRLEHRLPMRKPSGKYNVYNKTRYLPGTSH